MFGIVAYILASQMIYYLTLDWTWFVWSAVGCMALFAVGLLMCRGRNKMALTFR